MTTTESHDSLAYRIARLKADLAKAEKELNCLPKRAGQYFETQFHAATMSELCATAERDEAWLSAKLKHTGSGAFADSGEARICALLREFIWRTR